MKKNTIEQVESILQKINWAQEILALAKESTEDEHTADILSGITFIIDSASSDAEELYQALQ